MRLFSVEGCISNLSAALPAPLTLPPQCFNARMIWARSAIILHRQQYPHNLPPIVAAHNEQVEGDGLGVSLGWERIVF
ncbi:MAG: hypothetical protein ACI906_004452 [Candidatus Latescibacterota bacterium]|jgi:hypothetical protein